MTLDLEHWNREARLLPAEEADEAPAIDLGGVTVLAFLDGDEGALRLGIQVVIDDLEPELRELLGETGELPIVVEVLGQQCVSTVSVQLTPHTT